MRFPIDLYWIDDEGEVIRVDLGVPPGRLARCRRARCVIEVPASPVSRRGGEGAAAAT